MEVRFSLGDIVVAIKAEEAFLLPMNSAYRRFITEKVPDVSFELLAGMYDMGGDCRCIFNAKDTWSIHQKENLYCIKTVSGTAVFDAAFLSGKIWCEDCPDGLPDFSFNCPLFEILMINLLSKNGGMIVHACGAIHQGEGLLFIGSSGAGKSTLANLWKDRRDTAVLSDDRVIVRKQGKEVLMYGTPWHGDARMASPEKAVLKKMFFLKHAKKNRIIRLTPLEIASRLIVCSFPPLWDRHAMGSTLDFCGELAGIVSAYELGFVPDRTAVDFIRADL